MRLRGAYLVLNHILVGFTTCVYCVYYPKKLVNNFDETWNKFDNIFRSNPQRMWYKYYQEEEESQIIKIIVFIKKKNARNNQTIVILFIYNIYAFMTGICGICGICGFLNTRSLDKRILLIRIFFISKSSSKFSCQNLRTSSALVHS